MGNLDFNVMASSVEAPIMKFFIFVKVLRLFKIVRILRSAKILVATVRDGWRRTVVNLGILLVASIPAGMLIYMIERGKPCHISTNNENDSCLNNLDDISITTYPGMLLMINSAKRSLSQIPNAFYGYWFTVVTTTTTGYGDVYPQSDGGMLVTAFIIVIGSIYLSVPIAVMCDTFMKSYRMVISDELKNKSEMRALMEKNANEKLSMKQFEIGQLHSSYDKLKNSCNKIKVCYYNIREVMYYELTAALHEREAHFNTSSDDNDNQIDTETKEALQKALQKCIGICAAAFNEIGDTSRSLENI